MLNNKMSARFVVLLATTAIGICYWQMRRSSAAKGELHAEQRAMAETSTQLRDWELRNTAMKADAPRRATTSVSATVETHDATKADADAKAALQAKRKMAIAEALIARRVRQMMSLETNLRPKFHALGLSDEQWHRYGMLSVEKMFREDEMRRGGRGNKTQEEFQTALQSVGSETVDEIKALIGTEPYEELQRFQAERSGPARSSVDFLSERLLFSNAPLETWQAEKLNEILRPQSPLTAPQGDARQTPADKTVEVQRVLSPAQFWAWRQLQSETRLMSDSNAIVQRLEAEKDLVPR